ncbi:MAG: IS3 family transposase [Solirubrobacterales bacterium]
MHIQKVLGISERRACRYTNQPRSTQRYEPTPRVDEEEIAARLHRLAQDHPRRGYRHRADLMGRDGLHVSDGRAWRLSRREGLQVPQKQKKRRRRGARDAASDRLFAERPGHVWSYDFKFDATDDTRQLKIFTVMDEFTRRALITKVARSIKSVDVVEQLQRLANAHGAPQVMRSDNGPEFIAGKVTGWLKGQGSTTAFIEPGSPWQNAYIESFHSRLEDELLGGELFCSLTEAQVVIGGWVDDYNQNRPQWSLGKLTPNEFYESWLAKHRSATRLRWQELPESNTQGLT